MANRFFTDNFTGNGSTFIQIPSYTGDITYDCYPRTNNTGLPGSPVVTLNRWNTITVSVVALTSIGAGFNGIIANILGDGLDVPLAKSDGTAEAPATLQGPGFIQEEYEEINPPYNDWAKLDNFFTPGSVVIPAGETNAFPYIFNNLASDGTRYYVEADFKEVDGSDVPTGGVLDYAQITYRLDGFSPRQMQSGAYGIGTPWYTTSVSNNHYVQLLTNPAPQRVELTSRVSEVLEYERAGQEWLYIMGNGQSLSVGGETSTTDPDHLVEIRNNNAHLSYGNGRPQAGNQSQGGNPGFSFVYEGLRPWIEEPIGTTHVYAMLSQLDGLDFPQENAHTITLNEGISGQNIVAAASYGPDNAGLAMSVLHQNENLGVGVERAAFVWIQGVADSATDPATYQAELRNMQDAYLTEIQVTRPGISEIIAFMDQPSSQQVYWRIAATIFDYALNNDDAHFVTPKYHINGQFPIVPDGDIVHLSPFGYDYQGEYHGRAINDVMYGDGTAKNCYCTAAYIDGSDVVMQINVPSPPLVLDETTLATAAGNGVAVRQDVSDPGTTVAPSSVTIVGDTIRATFAETLAAGDFVEFGNNNTAVPGIGSLPITNFRDSSPDVGVMTGEPLHNWLALHEIAIGEAPPPPSGGGFICGGLSLGIGIVLTNLRSFGGGVEPTPPAPTLYVNPELAGGTDLASPPTSHGAGFGTTTGIQSTEYVDGFFGWLFNAEEASGRGYLTYDVATNNPALTVGETYVISYQVQKLNAGTYSASVSPSGATGITINSVDASIDGNSSRRCLIVFTVDSPTYALQVRFGNGTTADNTAHMLFTRPRLQVASEQLTFNGEPLTFGSENLNT